MQACSSNRITQTAHGTSKAVDYSAIPDPIIYAPEDGTIDSYIQRGSGTSDAGLALRMRGANGLHQFGHTERSLVAVGERVKRGQPIAVMGYTGYTIPDNVPAGSHVHWWVQTPNGYVYPPNLINEPFMKLGSGGDSMDYKFQNESELKRFYFITRGNEGTLAERQGWVGKTVRQYMDAPNLTVEVNNRTAERNQLNDAKNNLAAQNNTLNAKVSELEKKLSETPKPSTGKPIKDYTLGEITKALGL